MMKKFLSYIKNSSKGQSLTEYALILGLVVVVGIGALSQWGRHLNDSVEILNDTLDDVNTSGISTTGT